MPKPQNAPHPRITRWNKWSKRDRDSKSLRDILHSVSRAQGVPTGKTGTTAVRGCHDDIQSGITFRRVCKRQTMRIDLREMWSA